MARISNKFIVGSSTAGEVLTSNGAGVPPSFQAPASASGAIYISSVINVNSSGVSSSTFTTFDNSPALTFTPSVSGTYKVYCSVPLENSNGGSAAGARIINTTGSATLLSETQITGAIAGSYIDFTGYIESIYTLTAGISYTFDIQGKIIGGGTVTLLGASADTYMIAELSVAGTALNSTPAVAYISDQKSSGTDGGSSTSGAWYTRDLNTLSDPQSIGISLSSNQFTLPAGTYEIDAVSPMFSSGHKAKLYNVTDASDTLIGSSAYAQGSNAATPSFIKGIITIGSTKTFEIQYQCQVSQATYGLGAQSGFGVNEVYAQVIIRKLN